MDIQTSKLELVQLILKIENKQVIENLISVLNSKNQDFWEDLSSQQKNEIQLGIQQLDAGQRIRLEDFIYQSANGACHHLPLPVF
jgi:hypothetical protein